MKVCSRCNLTKERVEFSSTGYCNPCQSGYIKEWQAKNADRLQARARVNYRKNREKIKEGYSPEKARRYYLSNSDRIKSYAQSWRYRNPSKSDASRKSWNRRNPDAVRAGKILRGAVHAGRILKPENCETCLDSPSRNLLHGHHGDHSKPLEVRWLCSSCHGEFHRLERVG